MESKEIQEIEKFLTSPPSGSVTGWFEKLIAYAHALLEENKRLREALEFYADPRTWTTPSGKTADWLNPIWKDQQLGEHIGTCGLKARQALGGKE